MKTWTVPPQGSPTSNASSSTIAEGREARRAAREHLLGLDVDAPARRTRRSPTPRPRRSRRRPSRCRAGAAPSARCRTTVPTDARRPSRIHPSSVGSTSRMGRPLASPGPDPMACPKVIVNISHEVGLSRRGTAAWLSPTSSSSRRPSPRESLPGRPRPRGVGLPRPHAAPAAAARGRAGGRQDRDRPDPGAGARRRADPPAVLRGHRRRRRRSTSGTTRASCSTRAPSRRARSTPTAGGRALRARVPGRAAAAAGGARRAPGRCC